MVFKNLYVFNQTLGLKERNVEIPLPYDTTTKEEATVPNGPLYGVEGTIAKYQDAGHMDTADTKLCHRVTLFSMTM